MKIAICFSGQIRTGAKAVPNIKRFIGELWHHADFFVHTWNYESSKDLARNSFKGIPLQKIEPREVQESEILEFTNQLQPKKLEIENHEVFRQKFYGNYSYGVPNTVWYTIEQVLKLRNLYELENKFKYDAVIRMRPDIIYPASRKLSDEIENFLKNPNLLHTDVYGPYRLDDVFWIMDSNTANKFFGLREFLDITNCDARQKVLDFLQLKQIITHATLRIPFPYAVFRRQSEKRDPLTEYKEIFRDDIMHYSMGPTEDEILKKFECEDTNNISYD